MSIFSDRSPLQYDEEYGHILEYMERFYADSVVLQQPFWSEASIDTRFEAGDQEVWNGIYGSLNVNRRRQFNFNRIRRIVNMVSGHQRNNRKSTVVIPVEDASQKTADQFTKAIMQQHRQDNTLQTISDAFHGACVTGMNFLHVWIDYRTDPVNGNIRVDNLPYNSIIVDPYFKKHDLSDCQNIWKRSYVTKREAISLLPDKEEDIMNLSPNALIDGKFNFMPENNFYSAKNLISYDEFYYRTYRTAKMIIDSVSGEVLEWSGDDKQLDKFLDDFPQMESIDQEIPTVRMSVVIGGQVMYDGPNPTGLDDFPFVPVLGYYNPHIAEFSSRVQGIVRGLRDAQFLYNRRKNIELDILESRVTSGWIFKEDALVNPKDIFMTQQGKGIALKKNAQMTDISPILPPEIPQSMAQLSAELGNEIQEIAGVSEELLGTATEDRAGILSMLRQSAGVTILQPLFDNLDFAQKRLGMLMIKIMQKNYTPAKIQKIIKEEPSEEFYNKAFGKYDAAVEEGLNTTTQRQMQFAQLLHLKEAGIPVPDDVLIETSTLQNKDKLIEAIQQENQRKQQMEQQQAESTMMEQRARSELAQARAQADRGLGEERISRVRQNESQAIENIFDAQEKDAQSKERRASALLEHIKALKEIEGIDIDHVERLSALAEQIRKDVEEEPTQEVPRVPEPAITDPESIGETVQDSPFLGEEDMQQGMQGLQEALGGLGGGQQESPQGGSMGMPQTSPLGGQDVSAVDDMETPPSTGLEG